MKPDAAERWLEQLIDPRNTIEVVLFGLTTVTTDWHIGPRILNEHLIYFPLQHHAEGTAAGKPLWLEPNDLLWLAPGIRHEFTLPQRHPPLRLYHFRFKLHMSGPRNSRICPPQDRLHLRHAPKLRAIIDRMYEEHRANLPLSACRFRILLADLLSTALQENTHSAAGRKRTFTPAQKETVEASFSMSSDMRIDPSRLATSLQMSPDYFARVFKNTFGLPPRIWIAHERIRRASEMLLESCLNISQIADTLGYGDLFSFSRQFKEIMGLSPRAFRQRH